MTMMKTLSIALLVMILPACATTQYQLPDYSVQPLGFASVTVTAPENGVQVSVFDISGQTMLADCITPCALSLDTSRPMKVTAQKNGRIYGNPNQDITTQPGYLQEIIIQKHPQGPQAQNYFKTPPFMEQIGRSGFCSIIYDINTKGLTENLRAAYCTEQYFETPSIESIVQWKFFPLKINGIATMQKNVVSDIEFRLVDDEGVTIPSPVNAEAF